MDSETPYLLRGFQPIPTESPTSVSSSRYLNSLEMRDWLATHLLRRSHKSLPTPSDMLACGRIVLGIQDLDAIEDLFTAERQRYPALDKWLSDGFVSRITKTDLEACPPNSIGAIFLRYVVENGFQIEIVPPFEPKTQYQYFLLRSGQTHDFEHIMCGGGFNVIGELIPYYMRLANIPKFFSPALSGEVNAAMVFGSSRILVRTGLHYPEAFPAALEAVQRGIRVGQKSSALFLAKYEDILHLTVEEARLHLGVIGADDFDSAQESLAWEEYQ